jgi:hypothetical protein
MSSNVSKQSLDALANTALTAMLLGIDSEQPRVEYALDSGGAGGALSTLVRQRFQVESPEDHSFISGVHEGFDLALGVAAALFNNPLDLEFQCVAIEVQLAAAIEEWNSALHEPVPA